MHSNSQLRRTGNKVLLKGGVLEDAITAAITAMNEPKTCSTTTLRRYLIDANKDKKEYQLGKRLLRWHYPGYAELVCWFGSSKSAQDWWGNQFSWLCRCATRVCPLDGAVTHQYVAKLDLKFGFLQTTGAVLLEKGVFWSCCDSLQLVTFGNEDGRKLLVSVPSGSSEENPDQV